MFVDWIDKLMCEYFMDKADGSRIFSLDFFSWNSFINEDLLVVFVFEGGNDGCQDILGIVLFKVAIFDGIWFSFSP